MTYSSEVQSIIIKVEHGMQADMVLEKELRVLYLWSTGNRMWTEPLGMAWAYMRPQSQPPQWHTSSNKAAPNSDTSDELMSASYIQTAIDVSPA